MNCRFCQSGNAKFVCNEFQVGFVKNLIIGSFYACLRCGRISYYPLSAIAQSNEPENVSDKRPSEIDKDLAKSFRDGETELSIEEQDKITSGGGTVLPAKEDIEKGLEATRLETGEEEKGITMEQMQQAVEENRKSDFPLPSDNERAADEEIFGSLKKKEEDMNATSGNESGVLQQVPLRAEKDKKNQGSRKVPKDGL